MTPMSEAVVRARCRGGEPHVDRHDVVTVSGNGGIPDDHGRLVLGPEARSGDGEVAPSFGRP